MQRSDFFSINLQTQSLEREELVTALEINLEAAVVAFCALFNILSWKSQKQLKKRHHYDKTLQKYFFKKPKT